MIAKSAIFRCKLWLASYVNLTLLKDRHNSYYDIYVLLKHERYRKQKKKRWEKKSNYCQFHRILRDLTFVKIGIRECFYRWQMVEKKIVNNFPMWFGMLISIDLTIFGTNLMEQCKYCVYIVVLADFVRHMSHQTPRPW